jgi:hypothetical protein
MSGKGDKPRDLIYTQEYRDNFDKIFGNKTKARKKTPDHAKTKTHKDKTKYDRNKEKKDGPKDTSKR